VGSGEAAMLVDNVDGDHLLAALQLWSDIIVFTSVTPVVRARTSHAFFHSHI